MNVYILYYLDGGWGWELENVFHDKEAAETVGKNSGEAYKVEEHTVL